MNSNENAPRSQEQPGPRTQEQPPSLEDQRAQLQSEVGDWSPQQMNEQLAQLDAQREQLRARLDKEAEGKGKLSQWIAQAREKLGRLNAQEKADREQLHHLDEQSRIIQEQRIKAGVKPESVADNDVEAAWFVEGDAMNDASETKVSVNETQHHKDLASILARQQLEIIQSDGSEAAEKAIKEKYAVQVQEAMAAAIKAGEEESATEQMSTYDRRKMADASAERTTPTEMQNMVIGETPNDTNVDQDEQATIQAREVTRTDAVTEMIGEETGELNGDDSVAEPTLGMPDAIAENVPADLKPANDPNMEAAEANSDVNEDIRAAEEAEQKRQEAIEKLYDDREAMEKQLQEWGALDVVDNIVGKSLESIQSAVMNAAVDKGWSTKSDASPSLYDRFTRMLFVQETPQTKPDVRTIVKALTQLRNTERAIQHLLVPDNAPQMPARSSETSAEAIARRLSEIGSTKTPQEKKPPHVVESPQRSANEAEPPTEMRKAS